MDFDGSTLIPVVLQRSSIPVAISRFVRAGFFADFLSYYLKRSGSFVAGWHNERVADVALMMLLSWAGKILDLQLRHIKRTGC